MKPLLLKLKGINSYREEQIIDFETLTSQGLFGIFGPTGSGKSSILDAITLALYAKLPRSTKNFININEKKATISFLFSITTTKTTKYLVERTFRYHGKDGDATVRNVSGRLLEIADDAKTPSLVLADRPTEVTQGCTTLLGLASEDFMRTVVLPQGQFSEFLKLKNSDRRGMLQRIFHLEKYGMELTAKIAKVRQKQDLYLSQLEGEAKQYDAISPEVLEEIEQHYKETLKKKTEFSTQKEKDQLAFLQADEIRSLCEDYIPVKKSYEEGLSQCPAMEEKEAMLEIAQKANRLLPFSRQAKNTAHAHSQTILTLEYLQKDFSSFSTDFETKKQQRTLFLASYSQSIPTLLQKEQQLNSAITIKEDIENWSRKKEDSSKILTGLTHTLKKLTDEKERLAKEETLQKNYLLTLEKQAELSKISSKKRQEFEAGHVLEEKYREKRSHYIKNKEILSNTGKQLETAKKEFDQGQAEQNHLYSHCVSFLKHLTKQQQACLDNCLLVAKNREQAEKDLEQLQDYHLAESLREHLTQGTPCPVCGSLHHTPDSLPDSSQSALRKLTKRKNDLLKKEKALEKENQELSQQLRLLEIGLHSLEALRKEQGLPLSLPAKENVPDAKTDPFPESVETLNQKIQTSLSEFSSQKSRYEQLETYQKEQIKNGNEEYHLLQEALRKIQALRKEQNVPNFTEELEKLQQQEKEYQKLTKDLQKARTTLETFSQKKEETAACTLTLSNQIASCQSEISNYQSFIKEQKNRFPTTFSLDADLVKERTATQNQLKKLEQQKEQLENIYQEASDLFLQKKEAVSTAKSKEETAALHAKEAKEIFLNQLKEQGFSPDTDLDACALLPSAISEIKNSIESFYHTLQQTKERMEYLKEKLQGREISIKEWNAQKEKAQQSAEEYEKLQKEAALLEHQRRELFTQLKEKETLEKKQKEAVHKRSRIRELEQLFKGNAFIEYVAESRLKYIAKEASAILFSISNGNYSLEVNEATEFIIRDNKNGGVLRPCDTLSGGETFITSLSLALSLSSVIQLNGTAPLELFFLDEGFGSLDDELLDVVMTSLERLQNKKRSIGIITHVESIQTRVPVKLVVTPSDLGENGSSISLKYS